MSVTTEDVKEGKLNDQLASQLESISARVEANVEKGRNALADLQADAGQRCRELASATNEFVRERPWEVVGIAAAVGLVVGLLCSRR
jgi:ElaB/YqjD/DUF883 family membrane-anchored ribosome-binding protein